MQAPVEIGRVVKSKSGRDKDRFLVVYSYDGGNYVYLVDGALRKVASPKKKKLMHIEPTGCRLDRLVQKLRDHETIMDAEVRKALAAAGFGKDTKPANKEG
ncbi:KOW domain-containing RNA-binding protein [Christensenella sp. MSJ-20]|uniref:KOW domain-containing RNA-binding protein n=1 Tax=Christensenella sp. MSJ-20 TaxID=2841518 RepID=UPI000D7B34DE|nr:MAG: RNA-binding protein [Bacillota bacterium]QWT55135.1 KOW domain-containing RNA-binding protein [Christensenella sp. MSJ-20]